ncbi:MAG: AAA family ATPase [Idiomarinaceae bacterium]|nr:AAA family ATPase [Idiomarinaceae bacterium]
MTEYKTFKGRDEFQRRTIAENIIKLIAVGGFTPMLLDGPWGSGKTEFSHKLSNLLEDTHKDWQVAYVDAFKADHSDEPLITLIAAIAKLLPEKGGNRKYLFQQALPTIKFGLKTTAKATVAHLTRESFDELAEEYQGAIDKALNKSIDATVESLLQEHVEADKNLEALQSSLRVISEEKPLILIIDELDRCRPDFAVEILELIKHVFDVPNVHFLLVTNTQQLKAAINHRYGAQVDAQRYLDKFLKFKIQISPFVNKFQRKPVPAPMLMFRKLLTDSSSLKNYEAKVFDDPRYRFLELYLERQPFSLREAETFVRNMHAYDIASAGELSQHHSFNGHRFYEFLGILLVTFNPVLANEIVERKPCSFTFHQYFQLDDRIECDDLHALMIGAARALPGRNPEFTSPPSEDLIKVLNDHAITLDTSNKPDIGMLRQVINQTFLRNSV